MFKNILLVGLGGFLGTIIRFLFYQIIKSQESFPVTFLINVIGPRPAGAGPWTGI